MNYFVTLRDLVEHGETYKTVLASAPNEVAAATEATHFASTVGWTREENIDVCSTVPAPPNAYAIFVHEDGSHELVLGYVDVPTRFSEVAIVDEILPDNAISVHIDEYGDRDKPRPYSVVYSGREQPASAPTVTISERVIARLLKSFKPTG